ncbi:MAG: hypothetical protein HQK56_15395 [Deltaproteobacteria bacterium]|nr:hypothetical protein [Deltaproteobacteria bacterium]
MKTMQDKFEALQALGFKTPRFGVIAKVNTPFLYEIITKERESLDYEFDGIVFSVNDLKKLDTLGVTNDKNCPKGQIALKFPSKGEIALIKEIEWSFEGGLYASPVAIFDPIEIEGANIARASLKSHEWMLANKCGIGSLIKVVRAGGVIPRTDEVITTSEDYNIPEFCPHCDSKVYVVGARLACSNSSCCAKEAHRILHFLDAGKVKGLGFSTALDYTKNGITLEEFAKKRVLNSQAFRDQVFSLGISTVVFDKIKSQLNQVSFSLPQFIDALSIERATLRTFNLFVENGFDTLDKILGATIQQIASISSETHTIGANAEFVFKSLHSNRVSILMRFASDWIVEKPKVEVKENSEVFKLPLQGKSVVFTGAAPIGRKELTELLESNGVKVQSSVNRTTEYLLVEDANTNSSKAVKARSLGVKIVSYADALAL